MALSNNPVYDRLVRNAKSPSLRLVLWLAFGLGLIVLAVSGWDVIYTPRDGSFLLWPLGLAGWAVALITPGIAGAIAVLLPARDQATEEYQLLRLTALSEKTIVWGYLLASLYKVRMLLGLVVALAPAAVLWPAGSINTYVILSDPILRVRSDPIGTSMLFLAIMFGLWVMNLLATAHGTAVGLRARNATLAAALVGFEMVVAPGIVLAAVLTLLGPSIGSQIPDMLRRAAAVSAGVCVLVPCLVTVGVIAMAQRSVREPK